MSRVTEAFYGPGDVLELTAPYIRTGGQGMLVGSLFAVCLQDLASGAAGSAKVSGEWTLDKTSAQAWTVGAKIYWDDTAKVCTTTSTSNTLIGVATAVAANPSSTGRVRLNGSF